MTINTFEKLHRAPDFVDFVITLFVSVVSHVPESSQYTNHTFRWLRIISRPAHLSRISVANSTLELDLDYRRNQYSKFASNFSSTGMASVESVVGVTLNCTGSVVPWSSLQLLLDVYGKGDEIGFTRMLFHCSIGDVLSIVKDSDVATRGQSTYYVTIQ